MLVARTLPVSLLVLPAAIAGAAIPLHAQQALERFAPPEVPVILTRSLYLPFPDGKQVTVIRKYELRFSRDGGQFRIDGRLLDTTVEAPPRLSALADLERRRSEAGLFPVLLDSQGTILESHPVANDGEAGNQAAAQARELVAQTATSPALRREIAGSLRSLTEANSRSVWPIFLFNPGTAERSSRQKLVLPDGAKGVVETRIFVAGLLAGGLPRRLERSVTTRLEGTQRTTREVWTFSF